MALHAAAGPAVRAPDPLPWLTALLACCVPTLLAYHLPPSATLLNQCVAVAAWGGFVVALSPARLPRALAPPLAAIGLVAAGAAVSVLWGALPASLGLAALGSLAAAALLVVAGGDASRRADAVHLGAAFMAGLLAAGVLSAVVAWVQVFAPGWTDGQWIATSGLPGRAVGNLRQPNHLCSLLLWAVVAAVALHELRWLPAAALWPLALLLVSAVELSASRTGAVGLGLLLLWGALDRRLSPTARWLLVATPLLYALAYGAMAWYGHAHQLALGAEARVDSGGLGDGGSRNSRLNIWRNAWALVMAHPLTGVGFGEFNFAWTLTAFPGRPTAFFDHTHNLPLQLAVELGLPLAALVLVLLAWALWRAWRASAAAAGAQATVARSACVLVLLSAVHSVVEYPLWYTYFLLPTAFAWGLALAAPAAAEAPQRGAWPAPLHPWRALVGGLGGAALMLGGVFAVNDYLRVVAIYAPSDDAGPLSARITDGQRSLLFAHHADYAAATNDSPPAAKALAYQRAPHALLDTRLMVAWAHHLHDQGQDDRARWLAARLREFNNPDAASFFDVCGAGSSQASALAAAQPFQCQAPRTALRWQDFVGAYSGR